MKMSHNIHHGLCTAMEGQCGQTLMDLCNGIVLVGVVGQCVFDRWVYHCYFYSNVRAVLCLCSC